jgi:hypothetical protein
MILRRDALLIRRHFSYPVVFTEDKGWSAGKTGLMFIPIAVGILGGVIVSPLVNRQYIRSCLKYEAQHGGERPPPELRLIPMICACWLVPIGIFIFAWTSYPDISWVGPCLAGLPIGFGFVVLYNAFNNYMVDAYQHVAASALAAKTFRRSIWGACTVLFTTQM